MREGGRRREGGKRKEEEGRKGGKIKVKKNKK